MTVSGTTLEKTVITLAPLDPLLWAMAHRVMRDGRPYSIYRAPYHMPYLLEPYRAMGQLDPGGRIVMMKAAQIGATEVAMNAAFWFMDTCQEGVLYVLPSDRMLGDFAQARLDKAIRSSPYLEEAFTDVSNVGLKIGFGQPLYLRGARSEEKLREIPVGLVIRDEYNAMDPEGREIALTRLGASRHKWIFDLSNPGFPETGIHLEWLEGTQEVWELECEKCGTWAEPRWPDSVVGDHDSGYQLVCPECGAPVDKTKGRWRALNPEAPYRSFRISQLISPMVAPGELMEEWRKAQGNATKLQVFWNFRLGLPYAPEGSRITDEVIQALPRLGEMVLGSSRPTVMGVDVGEVLHVVVRRIEGGVIWAGTCRWEELARKMAAYSVQHCGIDAMPETTKAKEFARQFPGKVTLIRYLGPQSLGPKEHWEDGVRVLSVPRTEAIDEALGRIISGEEAVASNLPDDFFAHLKAMTRQIVDQGGNEYAAWVETGPDHYAHALTYSECVRDDRPVWEKVGIG